MRKKHPSKEQIKTMNRDQLKEEAVQVITRSIMDLLEPCVQQRCSQWFDVIEESLSRKGSRNA